MKRVAIIPAGGTGRRMGGEVSKQYLILAGFPILAHTLGVFQRSPVVDEIILAVPEGDTAEVRRSLIEKYDFSRVKLVIAGGRERQDSVKNALAYVSDEHGIVVIHDGVRPFLTADLIERTVAAAEMYGAASTGLPIRDTVKKVDPGGWIVKTVPREGLWLTQTPQAFQRGVILEAYESALADGFYGTDDAMLVERTGIPVRMILGDPENIKVTTPGDLLQGEKIICGRRG
jgi:2-C-methyl-D-erythritol 4-phosphate cytidylyltransferase